MSLYTILSLTIPERFIDQGMVNSPEIRSAYVSASAGQSVKDAVDLGLYQASSVVEASDAEDLFAKTQHINEAWDELNPPVCSNGRLRSTSIGDIIVDHENGSVLSCASMGWTPVNSDIAEKLRSMRVETDPSPSPR